ncbi:MAG: S49 family peptidase [Dehalococcoidia bacterium]|nr:S49 family peptidase [Dehalococcoidia bacterium]
MTAWYVVVPAVAGLGIAAGVLIFVYAFPGKPKIGVIHVPYTVINELSAYGITEQLHYALRDDSIKAVVIKLNSPGGTATASERLYLETRALREKKPVVVVMNDLVASGGFLMAMGASYLYAQPSSITGNVGVVSRIGPFIPSIPSESVVFSGPHKLDGGTRREWIASTDRLKGRFVQIVVTERGDRLNISGDELAKGSTYYGTEAVTLGLADEIGTDSHAIEKAGELAGISRYDLVDVNLEVQREFFESLRRVLEPLETGGDSDLADALALLARDSKGGDTLPDASGAEPHAGVPTLQHLRRLMLYGTLDMGQEDPIPDFPMEIGRPNAYYLYVGHGP